MNQGSLPHLLLILEISKSQVCWEEMDRPRRQDLTVTMSFLTSLKQQKLSEDYFIPNNAAWIKNQNATSPTSAGFCFLRLIFISLDSKLIPHPGKHFGQNSK